MHWSCTVRANQIAEWLNVIVAVTANYLWKLATVLFLGVLVILTHQLA